MCNLRILRSVIYRILQMPHIQGDAEGSQSGLREHNSYIEKSFQKWGNETNYLQGLQFTAKNKEPNFN